VDLNQDKGEIDMRSMIVGIVAVFACLTFCFPAVGSELEATVKPRPVYTAHDATVVTAGVFGKATVFSLMVGTSTTAAYFMAPQSYGNQMLAIALAALANGRKIQIWKDDSISAGGVTVNAATPLYGMALE
jgi:hypothetical protein